MTRDHKEEMIAMRSECKTYREIAERFGVSKQRVYQVINGTPCDKSRARKCDFDLEKIVYEGIYKLFANDYKMTVTRFAKITLGVEKITGSQKETIRRLIYNYGGANIKIRHIRNICEYIGEPFEDVFKVRK